MEQVGFGSFYLSLIQNTLGTTQFSLSSRHLLSNLLSLHLHSFCLPLICGSIESVLMTPAAIRLLLISRIARTRAGTGFWCRGVDEKGDVAMEVETQVLCISKGILSLLTIKKVHHYTPLLPSLSLAKTASFTILRGSVPLIWDQFDMNLNRNTSLNTSSLRLDS